MMQNTKRGAFAWLQIVRAPNVFTAPPDVIAGWLLAAGGSVAALALLIAASVCLYAAGMVLNDVYDVEQDATERPHRPIPSGRIARETARKIGFALLVAGVGFAALVGFIDGRWTPTFVALILASSVWLYDVWAKRTPAGPLFMGACRGLNVLLGAAAAEGIAQPARVAAAGLGVYIAGVTWFARTEAKRSSRPHLVGASTIIIAGLLLIASLAHLEPTQFATSSWRRIDLLILLVSLPIGRRLLIAVVDPAPEKVQPAIKTCIMSLIVLNAALALAAGGPAWGIVMLAFLAPAILLGRWVYST